MLSPLIFFVFPALMVYAAVGDFLSMTISNRICVSIAVVFFPTAVAVGMDVTAMALHVSCAVAALAVGVAMFSRGWVAGGDAKLFAAAALWMGWEQIADYAATVVVAGGVVTLAYLALRLVPAGLVLMMGRHIGSIGQTQIPYGIAISVAALAVYPHSAWVKGLLG